ncbi:MAG: HAD family hydrolase [Oscillospiraceae bacterium]|nr:HAD family hydrolase [Oscillospiraceae bacterium]
MKNADYKAAIFDIDGTLVPFSAVTASDATCRAVRALRRAGVTVIIATGRGPTRATPAVIGDVEHDYLVCVNGACTLGADGRLLFADTLSREEMEDLLRFGKAHGASINFTFLDGYYAYCGRDALVQEYAERCGEALEIIDATAHPRTDDALPFGGFLMLPDDVAAAYNEMHTPLRLVRFICGHHDICKRSTDKANSLARLLASIGMGWSDAVVFGDGLNDVEMLAQAGLGVSFADASAQAQAVSGYIAPASCDDGVARALNALFDLAPYYD